MKAKLSHHCFVLQECQIPKRHCDNRVHIITEDARTVDPLILQLMHRARCWPQIDMGFNTVLSDMCHNTLGNAAADVPRSLELARCAAALALGKPAMDLGACC